MVMWALSDDVWLFNELMIPKSFEGEIGQSL